jgi:hypothetical protein
MVNRVSNESLAVIPAYNAAAAVASVSRAGKR